MYIPPHFYISEFLQRESALYGMRSPSIQFYCTEFIKLCSKFLPEDRKKFLKPLRKMVKKKKTFSDEIILMAKKMGCHQTIDNASAAELAIKISDGMKRDINTTKKMIKGLDE